MKMKMKSSVILGALSVAPVWGQHTLTAESIQQMGNNTLFERWRPTSHFLAPAGWMNVGPSLWDIFRMKLIQ